MSQQIFIKEEVLSEARETVNEDLRDAALIIHLADGTEQAVPAHLKQVLFDIVKALADSGDVAIGQMPDELSSTVAADLLGVSRPTLMKWVEEGKIDSHKVGSHARFRREDVLALKEQRAQDRSAAFAELRALDAEFDELLED